MVGSSGQAHLARQLIEFLMGETDGVPKDAKVHIFQFRLSFRNRVNDTLTYSFIHLKLLNQNFGTIIEF